MKIKSFIAGITMLAAGGTVGMVAVWGLGAVWLYHYPHDIYKWSANLQAVFHDRNASEAEEPFATNYYAVHTFENGHQVFEDFNIFEFSTRSLDSSPSDVYAMRDGTVTECKKNYIQIRHSGGSILTCSDLELKMPCQVGKKVEGGKQLGTTLAAKPEEDQ